MKTQYIVTVIIALLFSISIYAGGHPINTSIQAPSEWTNQSGSTLHIDTIGNNGLLTGTYINRAHGYLCQNIPYPVTGWVIGTAITFNTLWKNMTTSCDSITAWTGFYNYGEISTLWQLTINGFTNTSQIMRGSDIFRLENN